MATAMGERAVHPAPSYFRQTELHDVWSDASRKKMMTQPPQQKSVSRLLAEAIIAAPDPAQYIELLIADVKQRQDIPLQSLVDILPHLADYPQHAFTLYLALQLYFPSNPYTCVNHNQPNGSPRRRALVK